MIHNGFCMLKKLKIKKRECKFLFYKINKDFILSYDYYLKKVSKYIIAIIYFYYILFTITF